jgi:glycosyltransferase involved in cell wall biosynthesis
MRKFMKIGVFTSSAKPNWGGSYSLQVSLVNSIINNARNSNHFFIIVNQLQYQFNENELPANVKIIHPKFKSFYFFMRILRYLIIEVYNFIKYPGTTFSIKKLYSKSLLPVSILKEIDLDWSISPLYLDNGKPFILTIWDLLYLDLPALPEISKGGAWDQLHNHFTQMVLKATRIIVTSTVTKEKLISVFGYDAKKIIIIPLPYVNSLESSKIQKVNDHIIKLTNSEFLLYPAQLWPHKNHKILLDAVASIKNELKIKLIFTGSDKGNMEYLKREIKKLGIENHITFEGFLEANEFSFLFSQAKAILFPSLAEPDNLPAIDAIMNNKVVFCADVPGIRDQLFNGAFYIDPFDVEGWAKAIMSMQNNTFTNPIDFENKKRFLTNQDYVRLALNEIDNLEKYIRLWS